MARPGIPELPPLTIRDLEFVYRPNFEGRQERYNKEGNRYFNAKIDNEIAEALARDGWNVKWTKPSQNHPNPEEHVPEAYLEVTVGFKFRPPKIVLIRDGRQTPVNENMVGIIDSTEFEKIDVVIRARYYEMDTGQKGFKAWLKTFYGTVDMDELDRDYNIDPPAETEYERDEDDFD